MDGITKPARTDVRPANGHSSSEWTLIQRVDARRPANERSSPSDARPSKKPSKWTFAQRTDARRLARTLVQRTVDVRPTSARPSPTLLRVDSSPLRTRQVNLNPFSAVMCSSSIMEEKGRNARADTPEASLTVESHEITIVLSGESAFLYGNVLTEGPEDCAAPSTSSGNGYDWSSREVLRTLNIAPTQLHPNSWGYIQAFAVLCQALAIRPTVPLFLRFFRSHLVARRGWVSLISELGDALLELYSQSYRGFTDKFFKVSILDSRRTLFFDEDGSPKFLLYWTQNPLRFTLWSEDKMTIEELEVLSVLTALPRPFSSRQLINCLKHDDFDSRVFGMFLLLLKLLHLLLMCGWLLRTKWRSLRSSRWAYTSNRGVLRVELQKMQTQLKELADVHSNYDQRQRQSEQLMYEAQVLLNTTRSVGLALKKERDELQIERDQMMSELEQSKKIVAALTKERDDLTKERDDLLAAAAEEREIREEMSKAIVVEHTRGFKKALRQVVHLLQVSTEGVTFDLRKDVYEGQMLPLDEIPDDAFMEAEVGVDDGVAAAEEPNAEAAGGSVIGSPDIVID
ncbi:hypothetical protein LR48_Vigan118s000200 [Vigna angularis]|uniref:Transposase (putative) gypsy type domain-containing protein n=1 Tax=Phaseolus angularis TaxID=3914 RepID=A0A0L9T4P8_PHAAN|nr:hypothetical protein LR48_Vigan118s000200 [Vigna angularis]